MTDLRVDTEAELEREREHLADSREAFLRMLDGARRLVELGEYVAGDRFSLESLGRMVKSHAKELAEEPEGPPFFGRLDFGAGPGIHAGRGYHLGRRHITGGVERPPMVIDWRTPAARPFYRASARDPQGVTLRRRFGWSMREGMAVLTGFEDERLGSGEDLGTGSQILGAEIERPRSGPMRDIVATIQPEQDDLVRAGLEESICVQGGPGTGKTAVGLHRAAFLLYEHRRRLERTGVLVLGPGPMFLDYIAQVLPALGEVDVRQTTLERLIAGPEIRATDTPEAEIVKHDVRMAAVLRRALYDRVTGPRQSIAIKDGPYRWRIGTGELRRLVDGLRREPVPYGTGRERLRARIVASLQRKAEDRGQPHGAWARSVGRSIPVKAFLDDVWPRVRPGELVAALLGDRDLLARVADGLLTPAEQAAIAWSRPRRERSARWTAAEVLLIDEAAGLIEHPEGYGHVIVDEAQDLSPMQCRAIARRSTYGSITVLGDLAQGTAPWAARGWPEVLAHLGKPEAQLMPLTTGFRVPAAVLELAGRLLGALGVDVPQTRPLRRDGGLRIHQTTDLPASAVTVVFEALNREGSIGVIATEPAIASLAGALRRAGIEVTVAGEGAAGPSSRVTVLAATLAKGLEYDHVVLAEPAAIAEAEARGLHRLYIALTRAVSHLDILHTRPLPEPLTG